MTCCDVIVGVIGCLTRLHYAIMLKLVVKVTILFTSYATHSFQGWLVFTIPTVTRLHPIRRKLTGTWLQGWQVSTRLQGWQVGTWLQVYGTGRLANLPYFYVTMQCCQSYKPLFGNKTEMDRKRPEINRKRLYVTANKPKWIVSKRKWTGSYQTHTTHPELPHWRTSKLPRASCQPRG